MKVTLSSPNMWKGVLDVLLTKGYKVLVEDEYGTMVIDSNVPTLSETRTDLEEFLDPSDFTIVGEEEEEEEPVRYVKQGVTLYHRIITKDNTAAINEATQYTCGVLNENSDWIIGRINFTDIIPKEMTPPDVQKIWEEAPVKTQG